jgi:hypothetical protein
MMAKRLASFYLTAMPKKSWQDLSILKLVLIRAKHSLWNVMEPEPWLVRSKLPHVDEKENESNKMPGDSAEVASISKVFAREAGRTSTLPVVS